MTEREQQIIKVALLFMNSNLDAVADFFSMDGEAPETTWECGGEKMDAVTEEDICAVLKHFQGVL